MHWKWLNSISHYRNCFFKMVSTLHKEIALLRNMNFSWLFHEPQAILNFSHIDALTNFLNKFDEKNFLSYSPWVNFSHKWQKGYCLKFSWNIVEKYVELSHKSFILYYTFHYFVKSIPSRICCRGIYGKVRELKKQFLFEGKFQNDIIICFSKIPNS